MSIFPHRTATIVAGLVFSAPVFAYIGPGAGLSAIGSVLALVGAVLLMILGFVWYPVKRILVRRKQAALVPEDSEEFIEVDVPQQAGDDNAPCWSSIVCCGVRTNRIARKFLPGNAAGP
jgi:hypothetical protein